ncbi:hypothetical protein B9Z19DRAFT_1088049 [Tuber borchii]|uniref:Uncharacterized protein n=1 Tax=Tuber borchii TaxID=42251 RepID=A0A2T6ZM39_TUBBO|nr:hypothetical protein B9Z19DRAFT_1088049 [Tuber borchii]
MSLRMETSTPPLTQPKDDSLLTKLTSPLPMQTSIVTMKPSLKSPASKNKSRKSKTGARPPTISSPWGIC